MRDADDDSGLLNIENFIQCWLQQSKTTKEELEDKVLSDEALDMDCE